MTAASSGEGQRGAGVGPAGGPARGRGGDRPASGRVRLARPAAAADLPVHRIGDRPVRGAGPCAGWRRCRPRRTYGWRCRGEGPSEALVDEAILANRIFDIWRRSRGRYGAPRVTAALLKAGVRVNEKRVARIMVELGVAGKCGRRKVRTTWRDNTATPAPDLVERDFTADAPDELWVGDITYIPTDEGWLFVASVLDVCTRVLVGWSIADHLQNRAVHRRHGRGRGHQRAEPVRRHCVPFRSRLPVHQHRVQGLL